MSYDICSKCGRPTSWCECPRTPRIDEPIRPEHRAVMNDIAARIQSAIDESREKAGFALLVFDFGGGGHMNYISNARREDMVQALRELLTRWETNN